MTTSQLAHSPVSGSAKEGSPALTRRAMLALSCGVLASGCTQQPPDNRPLSLWTLALSPFFDDYMRERISRFESAFPGIRVKWVDVPYDAIERKLTTAAGAGRAPDVVNLPDLSFARFAQAGAFADLDGLLPGDPRTEYLPGALGMCQMGKRLVCLPWYVNPQSLLANANLLREGGLETARLPRAWTALTPHASEFRRRTKSFLFSQPLGEESQLPIMMLAEGLPLFEAAEGRLVATLLRPEIETYLATWRSLYRQGDLPREAATRGHAHLTDLYQHGEVALINTGPNFLKRIRDSAPLVFESTSVGPGMVGALGRIHMPVMVVGVLAASPRRQLAAQLASFLTNAESQLLLCQRAAVMPSTISSLSDPFFLSPPTDRLDQARAVAAATVRDAVAFTPALDCWPMMRRAFEEAMKSTLLSSTSLSTALSHVNTRWNMLLKESETATLEAIPKPTPLMET